MSKHNGFTLIEALIATLILVTGLTAVAGAFSYSSLRSLHVLQETAATALMSTRMENLQVAEEILPGRYSEHVAVMPNGRVVVSEPEDATYRLTWEITSEMPRRVTVIVYGKISGRAGSFRELARATTRFASRF